MFDIVNFAKNGELFDGHYYLIRPLSVDGATADVWLALDTNTVKDVGRLSAIKHLRDWEYERIGLVVAIKIYRPQNALDIEGEQRFRDEYMIVYNCHHTNLIHPTHFSIFKDIPYLVLPYCKRGSSEQLIGNYKDNDTLWSYIEDVASGLDYLHHFTPPIIHQDIKPANILLDDTLHYSITDFGISAQRGGVQESYYDEENSGTLAYMAPERFKEDNEPIPQSDIWAFGATLYEIITGTVPYGEYGGKSQPDGKVRIKFPKDSVSVNIQKLICACLNKNPHKRPTARQLIEAAQKKRFLSEKSFIPAVSIAAAMLLVIACLSFVFNSPDATTEEYGDDSEINDDPIVKTILKNIDKQILRMDEYLNNHKYDAYDTKESNKIDGCLGEEMYIAILQQIDTLYDSHLNNVSEKLVNEMNQRRDSAVAMSERWKDSLENQANQFQQVGPIGMPKAEEARNRAEKLTRQLNRIKNKI